MADAEKQLHGKVLRPLEKMELNPLVVDLETTEKRLIAHYRVAGSGQMAAHTPRPLAPADSHMSVQIHESAINNAIEKVGLPGRTWTLPELGQQLAEVPEQPAWEVSPDVPTDLTIGFADSRPLTVEFVNGKMELTLRIAELKQPGNFDLADFIIRTSYELDIDGLKADLVHVGPISIDTKQDRLKLRTVFARVFAARQVIALVSDDLINDKRVRNLAVSQAKIKMAGLHWRSATKFTMLPIFVRCQGQRSLVKIRQRCLMSPWIQAILLLILSNVFMLMAWYGHLRTWRISHGTLRRW